MSVRRLDSICSFRNEKVDSGLVDALSYVTTENMLPNRGGLSGEQASLPRGKVTVFHSGDVLVSNIRPYFKKIWLADRGGSCSNDVLVFTPSGCRPDYLYWLLSCDSFFDYMTASSKGTKMPRGDKALIMRYEIPHHDDVAQNQICSVLNPIRAKEALNNRLNGYLRAA